MKYPKATLLLAILIILISQTACKKDLCGCIAPPFEPSKFALIKIENYTSKVVSCPLKNDTIKYTFFKRDSCIKYTFNDTTFFGVSYQMDTIPLLLKTAVILGLTKKSTTLLYDSIVYKKTKFDYNFNSDTLRMLEIDNQNPTQYWFIRQ
jgi:hypothetical protein